MQVFQRFATIALCGLVLGFAGCGRAQDDRQASAVATRFLQAVQAREGTRACAQLSRQAAEGLEHDEGKRCAEAVIGLDVKASPVRRTQVFGVGAKVDLADGKSAFLELTRSGWRVSAAGCAPQPDDAPYMCEVEA